MSDDSPMPDIVAFDSPEQMVEWLAAQREGLANRPLAPEQVELGWGSHCVRFMDSMMIFVWVVSDAFLFEEEVEVREQMIRNATENGLLYANNFSTIVPHGEYGSVHRSVLWPIEERTFDECSDAGWDLRQMKTPTLLKLEDAYNGITAHLRAVAEGRD